MTRVMVSLLALFSLAPPLRAREVQPAVLWTAHCAYCHDTGVASPLHGRALPVLAITRIVRHGGVQMPPFTPSHLDPAELQALAQWIHALPTPKKAVP
jgi:mono/diheme cytochrome c family protein